MLIEGMAADLVAMADGDLTRRPMETAMPRLSVWLSPFPTAPVPAMFEPKFYILLQGAKRLTSGDLAWDFKAGTYAVSSIGIPFTAQIVQASQERPYVGLELLLDVDIIAELRLDLPAPVDDRVPSLSVSQVSEDIMEALDNIIQLLERPADILVLGRQMERQLYYRLLQGPMGSTLRQTVQTNGPFRRIRAAVDWIRGNPFEAMCVERLAASVGMSVTSFHRNFKAVTAYSPLAFQRHIRLLAARRMLVSGGGNVTKAAVSTGYASPSQFSREYKRMFGVPPISDAVHASRPTAAFG